MAIRLAAAMIQRQKTLPPLLGAVLAALVFSTSVQACTKSEELLNIADTTSALQQQPCDPIGYLYLDGLSGDRFFSFAETQKLENQHIYYGFARTYLHNASKLAEAGFEDFDDAYASLMMSVYLSQSTKGVEKDRRTAYSAFAKLAYAQYAELRGTAQSMLISTIDEELVGSRLTNRRDLFCFIQHDMPHVPSATIVASTAFKSCVATEN